MRLRVDPADNPEMRALLLACFCCLALVACSTRPASTPVVPEAVDVAPTAEVPAETSVPVELRESFRIDTYSVSGRTVNEIRADLNRAGPLSIEEGRRFDAMTSWSLKWNLRYKRAGSGCSLQEATLLLDIVLLVPELAEPAELPVRTLAAWQVYRQALDGHEMGHVENQRQGAAALQAKLNEFEGFWESCRDLTAALKAEGDAAIQAIFAADRAHDESTNHGRLQGAVFP